MLPITGGAVAPHCPSGTVEIHLMSLASRILAIETGHFFMVDGAFFLQSWRENNSSRTEEFL
jgi:uncharacterized membrane protein